MQVVPDFFNDDENLNPEGKYQNSIFSLFSRPPLGLRSVIFYSEAAGSSESFFCCFGFGKIKQRQFLCSLVSSTPILVK